MSLLGSTPWHDACRDRRAKCHGHRLRMTSLLGSTPWQDACRDRGAKCHGDRERAGLKRSRGALLDRGDPSISLAAACHLSVAHVLP